MSTLIPKIPIAFDTSATVGNGSTVTVAAGQAQYGLAFIWLATVGGSVSSTSLGSSTGVYLGSVYDGVFGIQCQVYGYPSLKAGTNTFNLSAPGLQTVKLHIYSGVGTSGQPESTITTYGGQGGGFSLSPTSTSDNDWLVASQTTNGGSAPQYMSAGANTVLREGAATYQSWDSNGPKTPAGTYSINASGAASNNWLIAIAMAIAPASVNSENITVSESVTMFIPTLYISKSETITVTDAPTIIANILIDYIILGGGGGGGGQTTDSIMGPGGGGGGGGFNTGTSVQLPMGVYPIVIGAGGAGGTANVYGALPRFANPGSTGGSTSFKGITSNGGAGGGGAINTYGAGGATGGSTGNGSSGTDTAGTATAGGNGAYSAITAAYYGGGGGGGNVHYNVPPTPGGSGGGGQGGAWQGSTTSGTNGLGGGGGGGTYQNGSTGPGGNGGSGVVIVKYLTASGPTLTGGTKTTDGAYTIHTFTTDGQLVFQNNTLVSDSVTVSENIKIRIRNTIEIVLIGGGGGGGGGVRGTSASGSGSGGAVYNHNSFAYTSGSIQVTVGAAGVLGYGNDSGFGLTDGGTGGTTSFGGQSAAGGGGGYYARFVNGGASGGNSTFSGGVTYSPYWNGAGGGGATGAGSNANNSAYAYTSIVPGGVGFTSSISGTSVEYGQGASGGAGGAGWSGSNNGQYGAGGVGGNGGNGNFGYNGTAGIAGAVIISYLTGTLIATGGTITTAGDKTVHTFTVAQSGTYFTITNEVSVTESITVSENINISIPLPVSVNDSISYTENFNSFPTFYTASELVTISENLVMLIPSVLNPTNAYADDGSYATITGAVSGQVDMSISQDGGITYSAGISSTFTATEESLVYGSGATELWGFALTGGSVTNANLRLKVSHNNGFQIISQAYRDFNFSIAEHDILTGFQVSVNAKYNSTLSTISIDHLKAKIYYGTSVLPIKEGSQAYASDGRKVFETNVGTGVLVYYDRTGNWIACDSGLIVTSNVRYIPILTQYVTLTEDVSLSIV